MDTASRAREYARTLLAVPFSPQQPTAKQAAFLLDMRREVLYGGAAAGGKSSALLMGALQFMEVPGYSAIIFRRTYSDLALPGALMDRAQDWLGPTEAKWSDIEHTWYFPNGSSLAFGYIKSKNDRDRYRSAEFQYVAFDELTQFDNERDYRFLFSRIRRPNIESGLPLAQVPLRMRAATNPGGAGHSWVRRRFIAPWLEWIRSGAHPSRRPPRGYHPANLDDNPHVDHASYDEMLAELDPVTRAQMRAGDWDIRPEGRMFKGSWFERVTPREIPADLRLVRCWDMAATHEDEGRDPDWTVGVLLGRAADGIFYVLDVARVRDTPRKVEELIYRTAVSDGRRTPVVIEQEPGAAGKIVLAHFTRVLAGWNVRPVLPTGSKIVRAQPLAAQAQGQNVRLVEGPWVDGFLDEVEAFPDGEHDDQVDATASALAYLTRGTPIDGIDIDWSVSRSFTRESPWREVPV